VNDFFLHKYLFIEGTKGIVLRNDLNGFCFVAITDVFLDMVFFSKVYYLDFVVFIKPSVGGTTCALI
jgi:hypothetical protein